ncbi:hypothetical protein AACH06_25815 [Ideonella sp. DXS29W]|uniref:Uncharacterized protein n=1 Tax=Ideonella lacteola TaxID=2984193 RepID=A0ABU9C0Q3_9BURK
MTQLPIKRLQAASVILIATAGCASVAVTDESLQSRTSSAIHQPAGTFTISQRVDEGVKTSYQVRTSSGKQYSCYVTGAIGMTGRVVSDAICSEGSPSGTTGSSASAAPAAAATPPASNCNALLKAAGRCQ